MPTHYKGTPQEELALDAYIKFTRASASMERRLFQSEILSELTVSQFGVLETLLHLGPLSQTEICGKLLKSGGNITMVIDNLEKRKLVRRETTPEDRRVTRVSLTPQGEQLIRDLFPKQLRQIQAEMDILTKEEQRQLGALCKKLGRADEE